MNVDVWLLSFRDIKFILSLIGPGDSCKAICRSTSLNAEYGLLRFLVQKVLEVSIFY